MGPEQVLLPTVVGLCPFEAFREDQATGHRDWQPVRPVDLGHQQRLIGEHSDLIGLVVEGKVLGHPAGLYVRFSRQNGTRAGPLALEGAEGQQQVIGRQGRGTGSSFTRGGPPAGAMKSPYRLPVRGGNVLCGPDAF